MRKDLGLLPSSNETQPAEIPAVHETVSVPLSFQKSQPLRHLGEPSMNTQTELRDMLTRLEKVRHGLSLRPAEFGSFGRIKPQTKRRVNTEVVSEQLVTGGVGIPPTRVEVPPEVMKPPEAPVECLPSKKPKVNKLPNRLPSPIVEKETVPSAVFPVSSPSLLSTPVNLPNPRTSLVRLKAPSTKLNLPPCQSPVRVREGSVGVHREGPVRRLNEELKRGGKRRVFSMILKEEKKEKKVEKPGPSNISSFSVSSAKDPSSVRKISFELKKDSPEADSKQPSIELSSLTGKTKKGETPTMNMKDDTAPASKFSFGVKKDDTSSDAKKDTSSPPVFSFGTKNDTSAVPTFSFGAKKDDTPTTDVKKDTPTTPMFSFGTKKDDTPTADAKKDAPAAPMFSFGVKKDGTSSDAKKDTSLPVFSFGAKNDTTDTKKDTPTTPMFSFGTKKDDTPAIDTKKDTPTAPMFSFGAKNDTTDVKKDTPAAPMFSFGTKKDDTPAIDTKKDTPAAPMFSFGAKKEDTPATDVKKDTPPAFGIPLTSTPDNVPTKNDSTSKPLFFGSNNPSTPNPSPFTSGAVSGTNDPFSFSQNNLSSLGTKNGTSTSPFSLGNTTPPVSAQSNYSQTNTFGFGKNETSSSSFLGGQKNTAGASPFFGLANAQPFGKGGMNSNPPNVKGSTDPFSNNPTRKPYHPGNNGQMKPPQVNMPGVGFNSGNMAGGFNAGKTNGCVLSLGKPGRHINIRRKR